jgi:hypothetical protein
MINLLTGLLLQQPEDGDSGDLWFQALADNISKINDHAHVPNKTLTADSANWGADLGNNEFKQTLTVPSGKNYDDVAIQVRISTGEVIYPTIEKVTGTTFDIFTNDATLTYQILFIGV